MQQGDRIAGRGATVKRGRALRLCRTAARVYGKISKVSRTIADLEGAASIQPQHVSEAVNYRTLERTLE